MIGQDGLLWIGFTGQDQGSLSLEDTRTRRDQCRRYAVFDECFGSLFFPPEQLRHVPFRANICIPVPSMLGRLRDDDFLFTIAIDKTGIDRLACQINNAMTGWQVARIANAHNASLANYDHAILNHVAGTYHNLCSLESKGIWRVFLQAFLVPSTPGLLSQQVRGQQDRH